MKKNNVGVSAEARRQGSWTIRTKLIVYFTVLFVAVLFVLGSISIIGVPFVPDDGIYGRQRVDAFQNLSLIADLKKERLLRWIEERSNDIVVTANNKLVVDNLLLLRSALGKLRAEGPGDSALWARVSGLESYKNLRDYLHLVIATYGVYNNISIADARTGRFIISTDDARLGADVSHTAYFTGALRSEHTHVSDIELDAQRQESDFHLSHHIHDDEGSTIGVLVLHVSIEAMIKPIFQLSEGLGKKGEVFLVNQSNRILTSLKHPLPDGTLARPLEHKIDSRPALFAASGEEGIIETSDYRNEPVLAAYRHIRVSSEWGWGMVVKYDKAELFAPLRRDIGQIVAAGIIGVLVLIALAFVVSKRLTDPLWQLAQTARRVEGGDFSARASVSTSDEVGVLAGTFNSMVGRIEHWHKELEERVHERTLELDKANLNLRMKFEEQKRAEQRLRESEEKYENLYENAPDMFVSVDAKTANIQRCNQTLATALGYTKEDIIGRPIFFVYHPDCMEDVKKAFQLFVEIGEVHNAELQLKRKDGSKIDVVLSVTSVRDEQGKPLYSSSIWRDVTERKRAEEKLRESEEKLQRAQKMEVMGKMAGGVAHEVRNPLNSLLALTDALDLELRDNVKAQPFITHIQDQVDRLSKLMSDLLDFGKPIETTGLEQADLYTACRAAVVLCTNTVDGDPNIYRIIKPQDAGPLMVTADTERLIQVFRNLLENASHHTPGGEEMQIIIEGAPYIDGRCKVKVVDRGTGAPEECLKQLFEPFFSTRRGGSGLGLCIVKNIVESYGGSVLLYNNDPPPGCTVEVKLPIAGSEQLSFRA